MQRFRLRGRGDRVPRGRRSGDRDQASGQDQLSGHLLKWGIADDRELYDWHRTAVLSPLDRKNGSIILQNDLGEERIRWTFFRAWPSKYDAPNLNAMGKEVAVEALTLTCERFERA